MLATRQNAVTIRTEAMKTILVALDFSDISDRLVTTAATIAQAFGARLVLLHVSEPEPDFVGFDTGPMVVRSAVARDFRAEHQHLEEARALAARSGIETTALHIQGGLVEKILSQADTHAAELIVIGSHGHGALYDLLVGGVASGVLRGAKCPVLVVPSRK
jgi:nucleotide-binding universal stress UspA family protein